MKESGISVIITAYNRKEFLAEAINSVLHQTGAGFSFEIIVVSNFAVDFSVFEPNHEIRNVLMEGTIGEFLFAGLHNAKYDIVAFLDDDDTFELGKLSRLTKIFSSTPGLCYYHNDLIYVDTALRRVDYVRLVEKKSQLLNKKSLIFDAKSNLGAIRKALENRGDFNLSSIAIRKDCYIKYVPLLKQIKSNQDGFFFWIGLISMGQLMCDNLKFTNYRIHKKNVSGQLNFKSKNFELQKEIYTYDLILNYIKITNYPDEITEELKKWLYLFKYEYELMSILFTKSSRIDIFKHIKKLFSIGMKYSNTLKYRVLLLALLGVVNVKIAQKFYQKVTL